MEREEGFPGDDPGLLRRSLDGMPAGAMTIDPAGEVVQANATAVELVPSLAPGVNFRATLEELTHVEKVDRMLLHGEVVSFPGTPGGPDLYWMLWREPNDRGERFAALWLIDWSDELNERRADFTMAASHELRIPLTTLLGFAEILNMDSSNLTPAQAEAAAIVEQTARHLTVLVEDVFDLSRNSFGELRLNLAEIDLEQVIRSVVANTTPRIEKRGQTVGCEIDGELPRIQADPARARQMIANLVNNASVHNPEGVAIRVSGRVEGGRIAVTVTDDGIGLPFERPSDSFRTFQRGDGAESGDRAGSGIGLSITKRLIELHRGEIRVESRPGEGASFALWFPIDRDRALPGGSSPP